MVYDATLFYVNKFFELCYIGRHVASIVLQRSHNDQFCLSHLKK